MSLFRRTALPCLLAAISLLAARLQAQTPIQGGEAHSTNLEVGAGQFVGIVVEQDGVDLVVELLDPQGRTLVSVDGPDYWMWEEEAALIAEVSGPYLLKIRALGYKATPGSYRVRIDGPREPRDADRTRLEALREMAAGQGQSDRLEHLDRAIRIWKSLGDRRREAETQHQAMEALGGLGRGAEAAERFERAASLWKELGLPLQHAWTVLESTRGDRGFFRGEEARRNLEKALELARQAASRFVEVRALHALGLFHQREPRTAIAYLEEAERLMAEAGVPSQQLSVLYQLGYTYDDLAEKQDALRCYEKALELAVETRDLGTQVNTLNSLGHLYVSLGHRDKAVEHLEQAVKLSRDARRKAAALNNLALVFEKPDPAKARGYYQRALDLGREAGDREIQAKAIGNLALLDLEAGNASGAIELCGGALGLTEGDPASESHLRFVMGKAWRRLGALEPSRRELQAALQISRDRQDRVQTAKMIEQLARTELRAGELLRARKLLEEGIQLVESVRAEVVQEELRATFLASRQDAYRLHIEILMALHRAHPSGGHDAEALQASERARARSLLDILAQAAADVREGADPALIETERRLLAQIEDLEQRRLSLLGKGVDSPEVRETAAQLSKALEEHGRVEAELRVSSPRYAALTQPKPASIEDIRKEVLDGKALLLEYALGEERSYLWAVTPVSLRTFELPARLKIEEAARRWYGALVVHPSEAGYPEATEEARKAADELGAMLLGPVEEMLSGQPLLIVGDGALQYLPFGALPIPAGRVPLVTRHEVVTLPSASALAVLRRETAGRKPAPRTLAVLADPVFRLEDGRMPRTARRGIQDGLRASEIDPRKLPRLRFSETEAEAITALVSEPQQRFKAVGFDATRAVATGGELAKYRMVHFATHGLIDSRHPELSSLVLSLVNQKGEPQNGFLRLHDIYNLELQADLVVLSACETALGQEIRGEGLVGLTRGFMYAGSSRVLASLWSVDDRATSELMKSFYRHMISGRLSPAAALRKAQVDMSGDRRWSAPYYWAGFSLQGEWR